MRDQPEQVEPAGEPAPASGRRASTPTSRCRPRSGSADTSSAMQNATSRMQAADDRPAPRDRDRAAVVPRLAVGREAAGEDRDDRERDREVREPAPARAAAPACSRARRAAARRRLCCSPAPPSRPCSTSPDRKGMVLRSSRRASLRARPDASQGSRPASTCSVPRRCSAMIRIARARVALARRQSTQPRVLRVGPREHLGRVRRCRRSGRSSRPAPRSSPPPARARAGRLGEPDVEAHVGLAVGGEVVEQRRPSRRRARRAARARPARARSAASTATPSSTASRTSQASRQPASSSGDGAVGGRRRGRRRTCRRRGRAPRAGGRSARARSAPGAASSARCRAARTARARPAAASPGSSRPSLIAVPRRSSVSSNAVCERTGAKTGSVARRSQPLEAPDALPVGDGRVERRRARRGRC